MTYGVTSLGKLTGWTQNLILSSHSTSEAQYQSGYILQKVSGEFTNTLQVDCPWLTDPVNTEKGGDACPPC